MKLQRNSLFPYQVFQMTAAPRGPKGRIQVSLEEGFSRRRDEIESGDDTPLYTTLFTFSQQVFPKNFCTSHFFKTS